MLTVENSRAMPGCAVRYTPERRSFAHQSPRSQRPWTRGQTIDRRRTRIIDMAFLGLALFLVGRLIRAVEAVDLAVSLALLALVLAAWLVVARATGQLRRVNGRAQDHYERALRRWDALLYCADCAHAFRADGPGYLAPQAMPAYLARDGGDTIAPGAGRSQPVRGLRQISDEAAGGAGQPLVALHG